MGFPIENSQIYYYCQSSDMFVYCGYFPIPKYTRIYSEDFFEKRSVTLLFVKFLLFTLLIL